MRHFLSIEVKKTELGEDYRDKNQITISIDREVEDSENLGAIRTIPVMTLVIDDIESLTVAEGSGNNDLLLEYPVP